MKLKLKNKKGFTLVELLIAVLIMGILAAIVFPQYQFMIDKAHFANLQRLGLSIKDAYFDYYGITGEYPNNFSQLIIDFAEPYTQTSYLGGNENCAVFKDIYCCIGKAVEGQQEANITCARNDYLFAWSSRNIISGRESQQECAAKVGNTRAENLCKKLGTYTFNANLIGPNNHIQNDGKHYNFYNIK